MQKNNKTVKSIFAILALIALVFVVNKESILSHDSNAYFGMWPYVSAGYPFFLRGLNFLVGDAYATAAIALQFVAVIGSIYVFVKHFLSQFSLQTYQLIILMCLLFYPIFDSNIYAVNNISTEGLSFALFLQVIYFSYLSFIKRNFKSYIILMALTVLLITIRGQFQFLIPVFISIEVLLWWKEKQLKWKHYILIFMIPLLVFSIDNVYHKVVQKQYFSTPFAWTAFVTSVFFVSDDSDVQYLETEEQKIIFKLVKQQFKKKGIGYQDHKYFEEPIDYNYFFYHYEFPTLCNQTVQQDVVNYYLKGKENNVKNAVHAYLNAERINKQLFIKLVPHVFTKWVGLVFQNFKTGIGGMSVVLLYIISLFLLLKRFYERKENIILFCIFLLLAILVNRVVISLSIHGLTRYFFYTHWMVVFLLFLGINKVSENVE